jgi:uncharacterized protein with GYD domain
MVKAKGRIREKKPKETIIGNRFQTLLSYGHSRKAEILIKLYKCLVKNMPYYILLSSLTDEGWKTVKEKPERIKEVNKELQAFGVKVISQYAVLGPYDFVNIVEAPNNETLARVSIELGSRGTSKIVSMAAIPIDEFIASVKKR